MKQRRYSEEEKARLLSGWAESGESRVAYARRHGVSALSLARWEKELREAGPEGLSFVEVEVGEAARSGKRRPESGREVMVAEMELPGGARVRFYSGEGAC